MSKTLIQIFAKPPLAGKVKTRLIPDIGEQSATAVYHYCLQSNLEMLEQSGFEFQIWLTEQSDHEVFKQQPIHPQQGNDIGKRMYHALSTGLKQGAQDGIQQVILIGSDCLEITPKVLNRVVDKLHQHDLVFIPALDGGYVLIAARKTIDSRLFDGIEWSSDRVLIDSLHIAMDLGISTAVLNPLRDIDHVQDVAHYAELVALLNRSSTEQI